MFYGQKEAAIDEKGRMALPSVYRDQFTGQTCFASLGFDGCIDLYPEAVFEKIEARLSVNPFETDPAARRVKRVFLGNSYDIQIDSHNRILLPRTLIEKTSLSRRVVILGIGDHLQVWDAKHYAEISREEEENFAADAENLFSHGDVSL